MTDMWQTTSKVGAVLIVVAAGLPLTHGISSANPGSHRVTYTVTATSELYAQIFYMATEPPSMTAYADNTPKYLFAARPKVNSDAPWSYTTTLANPNQWADVSAYNHFAEINEPSATPGINAGFHCEIVVDGQVVVSQQGDRYVECSTQHWWPDRAPDRPGLLG
jgi:hypothetical protein